MNKNNRIAFFKTGFFSHTNSSVYGMLSKEFPKYEIEVIDLWEEKFVNWKSLKNIFFAWYEYGFNMFSSKKNILKCLLHNSYIFNLAKININKHYNSSDFAFTFQTQSQFDMSVDGLPHFVYTDNTAKGTYLYDSFDAEKDYSSSKWLECEKSIYNNATMNFTMSDNVLRSMIEEYKCPSSKVACAYIAPNTNIPDVIEVDKNKYKKHNILFVGKKWEPKGGDVLLKVFQKISKKYPDVTLTIVGCNPDINLPNCNVLGRLPVEEVGGCFSNATIFCLPTREEAFGIVYLEAMAYSLPVIGSNIGAIPEFIIENKNGFLCDIDDVDEYVEKLVYLIESTSKCIEFGEYGRKLYLEKYTWDNVGAIIKKNIIECIKNT